MSTDVALPLPSNIHGYQAVLRIGETLSGCRKPEELARILADKLGEFLHFDHLEVVVFKQNSKEVELYAVGKGQWHLPDVPVEDMAFWHVYNTQEPLHIADWDKDQRFPRLKQLLTTMGVDIGSALRLPLTTPHRRLGTLGIAGALGTTYSTDDIGFLQLIARDVAFAIDDALNLRRAHNAQAELKRQNDQLQLLLKLTNRITSNLELHELLRAVLANIREVMQFDGASIALPEPVQGKFRLYALDFPHGRGFMKEELLFTPTGAGERALDTLKPIIVSAVDRDEFPPELYDMAIADGLKSHCVIPLSNRGRALGLLTVARTTEGSFMPEDVEFLSQVSGQIAIAIENALAYREISELKDKLAQEKLYLEEEIRSELNFEQIIGHSAALKHVLGLVETVAPTDSTVLLLGETGTGKELIARAIHDRSRRKERSLVKLNCAAIPTGLLESELFGHEKGAFTGAVAQRIGRLELADQTTLFLDEIGDIPVELQPKLLRALQEREFERLGSTRTRKVDVRLVAATNRDLENMVAEREFRLDLYYRLNVFPIRIPPLRERKEDIPLLVSYFVQKFSKIMQKKIETIPARVMKGLTAWGWPGNIRELENFIERAVILTRGKSLEASITELHRLKSDEPTPPAEPQDHEDIARIVKETINALNKKKSVADEHASRQREEIVRALAESKGRVAGAEGAAARMGINRTTLLSRMKKLGINPRQYA